MGRLDRRGRGDLVVRAGVQVPESPSAKEKGAAAPVRRADRRARRGQVGLREGEEDLPVAFHRQASGTAFARKSETVKLRTSLSSPKYSRLLFARKAKDDALVGLALPPRSARSGRRRGATWSRASGRRRPRAGRRRRSRRAGTTRTLSTDIPGGGPARGVPSRLAPVRRRPPALDRSGGARRRARSPTGAIALRLPASRAFGTGGHESTRLALLALEEEVLRATRACSTPAPAPGVLALAAAALGARAGDRFRHGRGRRLRRARERAPPSLRRPRRVLRGAGTRPAAGAFPIVVANMLPEELLPILPALAARRRAGGTPRPLGHPGRARGGSGGPAARAGACGCSRGTARMHGVACACRALLRRAPARRGRDAPPSGRGVRPRARPQARRGGPGGALRRSGRRGGGPCRPHVARGHRGRGRALSRVGGRTGPAIVLYVAAVRAERLSWIAEKATELGAARLVLVRGRAHAGLSRARSLCARRLERVALAAAKQCGAPRGPRVDGPLPLGPRRCRGRRRGTGSCSTPKGSAFPARLSTAAPRSPSGPRGAGRTEEIDRARELGWTIAALPVGPPAHGDRCGRRARALARRARARTSARHAPLRCD